MSPRSQNVGFGRYTKQIAVVGIVYLIWYYFKAFLQPAQFSSASLSRVQNDGTCPFDFSIYLYATNFTADYENLFKEMLCQNDCGFGQFASELLIWKYLEQSPCRTRDPAKADLFYMPFLEIMTFEFNKRNGRPAGQPGEEMLAFLKNPQSAMRPASLPNVDPFYLQRYGGADHVMTLACNPFLDHPLNYLPFMPDNNITILLPEIRKTDMPKNSISGDSNIIVLPFTVINKPWVPLQHVKSVEDRRYLISGIFGMHGHIGVAYRKRLINLGSSPFARDISARHGKEIFLRDLEHSLADFQAKEADKEGYSDIVFDTIFCAVPPGDALTSRRFFNALTAGCIPVIFDAEDRDREFMLPFHRSNIPWQDMYIAFKPETLLSVDAAQHIFSTLVQIWQSGRAKQMQAVIRSQSHQILFDVAAEPDSVQLGKGRSPSAWAASVLRYGVNGGSAFANVMRELSMRKKALVAEGILAR